MMEDITNTLNIKIDRDGFPLDITIDIVIELDFMLRSELNFYWVFAFRLDYTRHRSYL
jgi:hypothetical protein